MIEALSPYTVIEAQDCADIWWGVFYHSTNRKVMDVMNVFNHGHFRDDIKRAAQQCKSKEEFANRLKSSLLYYFWSKSEWEIIMSPWCGGRNTKEIKVDVYWQVINNWYAFLDYTWENRNKL